MNGKNGGEAREKEDAKQRSIESLCTCHIANHYPGFWQKGVTSSPWQYVHLTKVDLELHIAQFSYCRMGAT